MRLTHNGSGREIDEGLCDLALPSGSTMTSSPAQYAQDAALQNVFTTLLVLRRSPSYIRLRRGRLSNPSHDFETVTLNHSCRYEQVLLPSARAPTTSRQRFQQRHLPQIPLTMPYATPSLACAYRRGHQRPEHACEW